MFPCDPLFIRNVTPQRVLEAVLGMEKTRKKKVEGGGGSQPRGGEGCKPHMEVGGGWSCGETLECAFTTHRHNLLLKG